MSRLIFHVDVNSAYLSWEAARKVSLGEDDIRLIPSAIGIILCILLNSPSMLTEKEETV